jgi:hypothetical protein
MCLSKVEEFTRRSEGLRQRVAGLHSQIRDHSQVPLAEQVQVRGCAAAALAALRLCSSGPATPACRAQPMLPPPRPPVRPQVERWLLADARELLAQEKALLQPAVVQPGGLQGLQQAASVLLQQQQQQGGAVVGQQQVQMQQQLTPAQQQQVLAAMHQQQQQQQLQLQAVARAQLQQQQMQQQQVQQQMQQQGVQLVQLPAGIAQAPVSVSAPANTLLMQQALLQGQPPGQ